MELNINNQRQTFIPLPIFRTTWNLPDTFQVALFEPENRMDLGNLDQAGPVLAQVKEIVVQTVPVQVSLEELFPQVEYLADHFQSGLEAVNDRIGLRTAEIDFARAGFEDILRGVADHLVRLYYEHRTQPVRISDHFDFSAVYQTWLDNSARVASLPKSYLVPGPQAETEFIIHVVYNAYGRVGLEVHANDQIYYVVDTTLACPAASYMKRLCETVAQRLCEAFVTSCQSSAP